jgi:hypothetical protein
MPKEERKRKPMAKEHDDRPRASNRGDDRAEQERKEPYYDDPREHINIERRRFEGGLPPTPELYALAREQWYRLPGSIVRPSMDPSIGDSGTSQPDLPEKK